MNKGLNNELLIAFPNIVPILTPEILSLRAPYKPIFSPPPPKRGKNGIKLNKNIEAF